MGVSLCEFDSRHPHPKKTDFNEACLFFVPNSSYISKTSKTFMIMGHLNLKALIVIFALPFVCLSCTETFGTDDKQQASVPTTKALSPDFGWICNECHFLNGGWRNNCLSCGASCDKILSSLTITFAKEIERELKFSPYTEEQAKKALENDPNLLELPTMLFAEHSPEPWFDTKEALEVETSDRTAIARQKTKRDKIWCFFIDFL